MTGQDDDDLDDVGDVGNAGDNSVAADDYDESHQIRTMMMEDGNHGDDHEDRALPRDLVTQVEL